MNRQKFKHMLETNIQSFSKQELKEILAVVENATEPLHLTASTSGDRQLLVAMEELCELAIELSREMRGRGDRMGILEELADVTIVVENIKRILNITDEELYNAIDVKLVNAAVKIKKNNGKNLR